VSNDNSRPGFGTFGGVFTPCVLTILGVIMFLRFGFVVGQAGILISLGIVLAATMITMLTTLSLSAIVTNTRVEGGGAYFLISRSLGVEFGGGIGLMFFLAQAISVAMYVIGFAEAFEATFGVTVSPKWIATFTNIAVCICVFIGAGWTIKVQYFILGILVAALGSFFIGAALLFDTAMLTENLQSHYDGSDNTFTMFALFFPAVTGIMAGANMSGDLKNPGRSIPLGTLLAVVVTAGIYLALAFFLGCSRSASELTANSMVISEIAVWPIFITGGVFAATLSSALGSTMGAPRILQALAKDEVFPALRGFAVGSKKTGEPRAAIILTFFIAEVCILAADLNTIAPLITMFFMVTYGLLNLATFYEAITKNPSYRPRFKYCHWSTSLAGAIGCFVVMFLIDWRWASVSIIAIGLLHWYIGRREIQARWGDLQSGLLFERTRKNLLQLEDALHHPKNWRPIILALSGAGWSRAHLAVYGHWFTSGHGILSLAQIIQGDVEELLERRANQERILLDFIREQGLEAFPTVVVASELSSGIEAVAQCQGLGALRPNTVLLGWPGGSERAAIFGASVRTVARLKHSIVSLRFEIAPEDPWKAPFGPIDVWWRGQKNGELMLLLAHLLTNNPSWRSREIRLIRAIENEAGREEVLRHLHDLCDQARIRATPKVIVTPNAHDAMQETSRYSAIVLLGFDPPPEDDDGAFFETMEYWAGNLPRVVFVSSSGGMSLDS